MTGFHTQPVIMQVLPELGPGGAPQGCIDIAAAIVKNGGQAIVVSYGGQRIHELARIGAVHINLPVHSKNPAIMWRNIGRLRSLIQRYNVNIVHARSRAPAWSAWRACKKTNARFMTTCHAPYNISGEAKKFYNSSMAQGERVIAISHFVAQYLHDNYGLDERTIRLVPRGIPMEKFHPTAVTPERLITLSSEWRIPDGANIIMLPGRLTRWKGHHVFVDAMAKLNRNDLFGVIIGSDQGRKEYSAELNEYIQSKGLGSKIRIVDHCNDMPAAYMLATVVVFPSTDPEGFGRISVEAQAMGRPIVASDHGGAQETIIRGQTGWLAEVGSGDATAKAIEEALSLNATQRAMLATHAMSHVAKNFTKDIMAERTMQVYSELMNSTFTNQETNQPFHAQKAAE